MFGCGVSAAAIRNSCRFEFERVAAPWVKTAGVAGARQVHLRIIVSGRKTPDRWRTEHGDTASKAAPVGSNCNLASSGVGCVDSLVLRNAR